MVFHVNDMWEPNLPCVIEDMQSTEILRLRPDLEMHGPVRDEAAVHNEQVPIVPTNDEMPCVFG